MEGQNIGSRGLNIISDGRITAKLLFSSMNIYKHSVNTFSPSWVHIMKKRKGFGMIELEVLMSFLDKYNTNRIRSQWEG